MKKHFSIVASVVLGTTSEAISGPASVGGTGLWGQALVNAALNPDGISEPWPNQLEGRLRNSACGNPR